MDLEARVAAGKLDPVLVLTGEDHVARDRLLAALRDAAVPPALRGFNYDVMDAKSAGADGILNAARTLPMMGPRRLVLVRDLDALGADGLAPLIPYLEAPNPSTVLVLLVDKADARQKFFMAARKAGVLHVLELPKQPSGWIQQETRRLGVRIEPEAARRLAEVVGNETGRLASTIEQLALFAGDRPISAEDVDTLVAETRERTVFELTDAVGEGNRTRALRAIHRLFEQRESSIGLVIMLARHFRQLGLVAELLGAQTPRRELPRLVGVPPFAVDKLVAQARGYPARAFRTAVELLARADRDLKSARKSVLGERVLVESLVDSLLALGTSGRR